MAIFDFHILNPKSHAQPKVYGARADKCIVCVLSCNKSFVAGVGARNGIFNR